MKDRSSTEEFRFTAQPRSTSTSNQPVTSITSIPRPAKLKRRVLNRSRFPTITTTFACTPLRFPTPNLSIIPRLSLSTDHLTVYCLAYKRSSFSVLLSFVYFTDLVNGRRRGVIRWRRVDGYKRRTSRTVTACANSTLSLKSDSDSHGRSPVLLVDNDLQLDLGVPGDGRMTRVIGTGRGTCMRESSTRNIDTQCFRQ